MDVDMSKLDRWRAIAKATSKAPARAVTPASAVPPDRGLRTSLSRVVTGVI